MYQDKLTTPERIAQQVQSGWLIGMDTATSQTPAIMAAMAQHIRSTDITGVKVQTLLDGYPFDFYTDPTLAGKMTGYSWFSSSAARKAVNAGYADIIPAYYRDFPTRIRTEYEYTFTNGQMDFAQVFNNKKRKNLGTMNLKNVEALGLVNSGSFNRYINMKGIKRDNWFVNRDAQLFYFYFSKDSVKRIIIIEVSDEMLALIKRYAAPGAYQVN